MSIKTRLEIRRAVAVSVLLVAAGTTAVALPPAPANDDPNNAEIIAAVPALIYGSTVLGDDSITTTTIPGLETVIDGPDVFYSFTPAATATYRFHLLPWQKAPLRSSDRRFALYVMDNLLTPIDGVRAPGNARPFNFDIALTNGVEYIIGIDHNSASHDNFEFTLIVDELNITNPDTCGTAEALSATTPVLRLNDIDAALHDYDFVQGTGRCAVSGSSPVTGAGNDHVYTFTPSVSGDYAIELVGAGFDAMIYVNENCPPDPNTCLGASNHSTSGTSGGKHELVVVTLSGGMTYYVFVDNGSTTNLTGEYALIIDDAFEYEINEIEPNDDPNLATPIGTPLNGGQLVGPEDVDYWAVTGLTGDRVYAWANNGGSSNSTLDTDLAFYAADGTTLIEFDDEDGDGANAIIEDLRYIYSTTSPVIAGARLTSDGTHYFEVTDQSATGTVHRYRFHVGVIPAAWTAQTEIEPNDDIFNAGVSGKNFFGGAITSTSDSDFYAFEATVGDRVFVAFDGDPERDSAGDTTANSDPLAFHGKLVIYDPNGDILISDISDSNSIQSAPDYPAQGGFFVARTTGTHYVEVKPQSTSSQTGPTETYELAIFLNDAPPMLSEFGDPNVVLTPDFDNDVIGVVATDTGTPTPSGICDVSLGANVNLQITNLSFTPGDNPVTFDIELVDPNMSGAALLIVEDCAGNTTVQAVDIDIDDPSCAGVNSATRVIRHIDLPVHIPDNNDPNGTDMTLVVPDMGLVQDVNVSATFECTSTSDLDIFLTSPLGTTVEIQTDRGSSLAFDIIDAVWDDDAEETMPILSSGEPYTGTWLPEGTLADFNGEQAQGTWTLNVADDSSSQNGGSRMIYWQLDILGSFPGPQTFDGLATDAVGIESIVMTGDTNVQLNLPGDFTPGDTSVAYTVTLIDPTMAGSATITVTDVQENSCQSIVNISGLVDGDMPANTGGVTTDLTFRQEVQADLPSSDPVGVTSTLLVTDSFLVGEVETELVIDSKDLGRLAATLTKGSEFCALVNRVGMDERDSVGLTKNTIEILLDDDAPVVDDAHLEPALGTIEFQGLHQPDGRGDFIGNGIDTDPRDNMLFKLANQDSAGGWKLQAADYRMTSSSRHTFRRWAVTLKSPCGPERYVGRATDLTPGSGIDTIALAGGASNLMVIADFVSGDEVVDYRVELVDPNLPGSGTLEITDITGNTNNIPISLAAASLDQTPPELSGAVNLGAAEFDGLATDNQANDTGVQSIVLAPFAENLQIVSITPGLPAAAADFTVGLVDPFANGRGYVQVTDGCGWRSYILVEIDATLPKCGGFITNTKRYVSADLPQPIPDNDTVTGVESSILVTDTEIVADVNIILNITHPYDDDIEASLTSPLPIALFSDIGSTGNNFIDTILDDEAAAPIPDSSSEAPFTGSYQPEAGPVLTALDGGSAAGTYTLKIVDDKNNDTGTFDQWSLVIESADFPQRYDAKITEFENLASGICTIELVNDYNLMLTVDPYTPGDTWVRLSVEVTDPEVSGTGRLRVFDCAGNLCETPITLIGTRGLGDMNCDGFIDFGDINPFVLALTDPAQYAIDYPACDINHGDINNNDSVGFDDINPFVDLLVF